MIQIAVQNSSYNPNPQNLPKTNPFLLPPNIKALITEKRRIWSRWQRTKLPSDKYIFNNVANNIKKLILKHKNEQFESKSNSLNTLDGSL